MTSYAQHLADQRNAQLTRTDIEWAVNGDQIYLRDRADWTRENTRRLEQRAERERHQWQHNHRERAD